MKYQRTAKRVETRTETTVELRIFSTGLDQLPESASCLAEQPFLTQQRPRETKPMPAEQSVALVLEETDDEPVGPWSPDPRIDRVLRKVRQQRVLQAQLDFLRESEKAWRRKYPSRFSRLLSSLGRFLGGR